MEFLRALVSSPLVRNAFLAGLLVSVACGIVGSYVVTRRITYIAGGIAHSVLGGMGVAMYLAAAWGIGWLHPLHGAVAAALVAAVIIGLVSLRAHQREDTVIGALWALGMAVGILFISRTPGYNTDLMSYLFGNILMISPGDLWLIAALDAVVVGAVVLFHGPLMAVCFDEEYTRVRNVNVEAYYLLLLCLTALTVVLLVTVVGVVLTIALLTLPAAVAGQFARTLRQMMVLAGLLSAAFTALGLGLSYGPDLPAGATIVAVAGSTYLGVLVTGGLYRRWRRHRAQAT